MLRNDCSMCNRCAASPQPQSPIGLRGASRHPHTPTQRYTFKDHNKTIQANITMTNYTEPSFIIMRGGDAWFLIGLMDRQTHG